MGDRFCGKCGVPIARGDKHVNCMADRLDALNRRVAELERGNTTYGPPPAFRPQETPEQKAERGRQIAELVREAERQYQASRTPPLPQPPRTTEEG